MKRHRNKHQKSPLERSELRIIGGQWRGRKLPFVAEKEVRPTSDRVRETLFNWIQFDVSNATCLDAFAGSGALGLEALSRGAAQVDFVELNRLVAQQLEYNLKQLEATSLAQVHQQNAEVFLKSQRLQQYSIVFLDPPFSDEQALANILALLQPCLADQAVVYIEQPKYRPLPELPSNWSVYREKTMGQVCYRLIHVD